MAAKHAGRVQQQLSRGSLRGCGRTRDALSALGRAFALTTITLGVSCTLTEDNFAPQLVSAETSASLPAFTAAVDAGAEPAIGACANDADCSSGSCTAGRCT